MNLKIEELNYLLTTKNEEVTDNLKKKARGIADDIFGKKIYTRGLIEFTKDVYKRQENIRRIAEVAKLMNDAGLIVITSFISPYSQDRQSAKEIIGDDFVEVYVSTPLDECERRDVKGLYKEARKGNIRSFTGISSPYEIPETPDVEIDTSGKKIEDCVNTIIAVSYTHLHRGVSS